MTETKANQLEVPMASHWALHKALVPARRDEYALGDDEHIRAIAAPVVAAELRGLAWDLRTQYADVMLVHRSAGIDAARQLERRANELDGGSRG